MDFDDDGYFFFSWVRGIIVRLRERYLAREGCPYGEKLTSGGQFQFSRAESRSSSSVLLFEVGYRGHPNGVSVFLL
jgi:hypothetical protein